MRRFLPVCIGWLILEAILLNGAAAFLPEKPFLLRSSHVVPALVRAAVDSGEVLFKETSSVSQELSLQCRQEHRQSYASAPFVDSWLRVREKDDRRSFVQIQAAPLAPLFFFPRRLSSSSTEDDPFLN